MLAWSPGTALDRQVFSVLLDIETGAVTEVVVSLDSEQVLGSTTVETTAHPYGQPGLVVGELVTLDEVVKADVRWQEAMRSRGITDLTQCKVLPLSAGQFEFPDEVGRRVMRAITLYQEGPTDIPWMRPIEGVIAYVDLIERRILHFADHGGDPIPPRQPNLGEGAWGPVRTSLRPLAITQPDGPSFRVDGSAVEWEGWSFRVGFDAREGLVLHQLGYTDGGQVRPIIHRASVSEMVVPYADPHPMRFWISYFDEGEYGLGRLASSLTLGCDCLGAIHYFDAVYADDQGLPVELPNVVCLHEEDVGVLWKHQDFFSGTSEVRRSRRLVVSSWAAIGNYDYGFFWYLYQDGTIEFDIKLTGIVFAVASRVAGDHAAPVTPELSAPFHQHLFNVRLDMTVDGVRNTVEEVDVVAVEDDAANPYGNAFTTRTTVLEREGDAARLADAGASRTWRIVNRERRNHVGQPAAYTLDPVQQPGAAGAPRFERGQASRLRDPPPVGDPLRPDRAVRGRCLPEPARRRGRPAGVPGGRSQPRRRGRRRLAHVRLDAHPTARGLARDARRARRVQPQAGQLLRPQPGARHPALDTRRRVLGRDRRTLPLTPFLSFKTGPIGAVPKDRTAAQAPRGVVCWTAQALPSGSVK